MSMIPSDPIAKGRLIAVVGPSGAGKDSVMDGLCAVCPDLHRTRRVITRATDAGGEAFEAVTAADFAKRAARGAFALHWTAHGLSYGIPNHVKQVIDEGRDVLANLSRGVLAKAVEVFGSVVVLHVTAPPAVLSQRVSNRGREAGAEAQNRLSRPAPIMPDGLAMIEIDNSGPLDASINAAFAALYPESM